MNSSWLKYREKINDDTLVVTQIQIGFIVHGLVISGHNADSTAGSEEMPISWSSVLLQKVRENSSKDEEQRWKGLI